jgi:hypothetical protein
VEQFPSILNTPAKTKEKRSQASKMQRRHPGNFSISFFSVRIGQAVPELRP